MFSLGGNLESLGGEYPRLSYLSRSGDIALSFDTGGERARRSTIGEGSLRLFRGTGDLGRPDPLTGDLECRRALGGDLLYASLRGEYIRGGDLGRPL